MRPFDCSWLQLAALGPVAIQVLRGHVGSCSCSHNVRNLLLWPFSRSLFVPKVGKAKEPGHFPATGIHCSSGSLSCCLVFHDSGNGQWRRGSGSHRRRRPAAGPAPGGSQTSCARGHLHRCVCMPAVWRALSEWCGNRQLRWGCSRRSGRWVLQPHRRAGGGCCQWLSCS